MQITRMQLGLVDEILAVSNQTRDTHSILERALGILVGAFQGKAAVAYLASQDQMRLAASHGLSPEARKQLAQLPILHETWATAPDAPEIALLDAQSSPETAAPLLEAMECEQILTFPLVAHDEQLGRLFIGACSVGTLKESDAALIGTIGHAVGLAIDNARLYQQMDQRLRESQALFKVSRALASTLDLDALLTLIVRLAVDTVDKASNGVLHLLDEETGELRPRALSFLDDRKPNSSVGRTRMRSGQGVAGLALETGKAVNIPDVAQDPRFLRVANSRNFASMLVAPLRLGDRQMGTLSIDSEDAFAFSQNAERLLMTLATQAATAIENARLVSDLQQSLNDLREMQEQLVQSGKLSAIGQLIAGVAHELNNPLTAVMGYAQLLETTEEVDESIRSDLSKIYMQAQRAAKIVQNLLTFARQHKAERQLVCVNELIERTLEMRIYQLRVENIEVTTKLANQELGTLADPNQLQTVFLNLINNAQDAMTSYRGRGHLTVSSELVDDTISVSFEDDGPGFGSDVHKHLFEPFFTTKEVGKGTGLGLSICFGIVSQMGGRIWAEGTPDQGAKFVVEIPIARAEGLDKLEESTSSDRVIPSKRILVIDDETDVAQVLERILRGEGHRVVTAPDGQSAIKHLARARERQQSFDLVISDVKMPGLNGPELYARIREHYGDVASQVIFSTGDTTSPQTRAFLQSVGLPHLEKPFTLEELHAVMLQIFG